MFPVRGRPSAVMVLAFASGLSCTADRSDIISHAQDHRPRRSLRNVTLLSVLDHTRQPRGWAVVCDENPLFNLRLWVTVMV